MTDMGFDQAWHPLKLPSLGYYYAKTPDEVASYQMANILPWSTAAEEMFVRYGGQKPGELIDMLLRNNVQLPKGLTYEQLLITDKFFLLVQLRCISLVPHYTVPHVCPRCNFEQPVQLNLMTDLKVKTPDDPSDVEPFEVKLPRTNARVHFRMLRVSDEKAIQEYEDRVLETKGNREEGSPSHRFRLCRHIVKINDREVKFDEKMAFITRLPMIDSQVFRMEREKRETGYLMDFPVTCQRATCGYADKGWEVPMHPNFFRPLESDIFPERGMAAEPGEPDALPGT